MRDARQQAPAAARNREPILRILRSVIPENSLVLEIASGTGEHGVYFTEQLSSVHWQPSDANLAAIASIRAWRQDSSSRLLEPLQIDVQSPDWWSQVRLDSAALKAIVNINMIHISPWAATEGLLRGAAALLPQEGILYLYGPYKREGQHTANSNAQFDQSLRLQNPEWGVRNLEDVVALGQQHGLELGPVWEMPANNLSVVLTRS
ncbi:MAG: DUF938 domain-containing protein [Cyanobacteria bacterium P01_F01_bin.42]